MTALVDLEAAIRLLVETHTEVDDNLTFRVMPPKDASRVRDAQDYVEAWEILRQAAGLPSGMPQREVGAAAGPSAVPLRIPVTIRRG